MKIEINEQKILTEILERDGSVHQKIKEKVEERIVEDLVGRISDKYLKNSWQGVIDEIDSKVLDDISEKQTEIVKKILREFYDSYRYGKKDLAILKKLKEFLGEN